MTSERIVAVGLLTEREVALLGPTFNRIWPVEDAPDFAQLVRAIDEADCALARGRGAGGGEDHGASDPPARAARLAVEKASSPH